MMIVDDSFVSLMKNYRRAETQYPDMPWNDALSEGQLCSKKWLVNEVAALSLPLRTTFVAAGWLGVLPAMLLADERLDIGMIRCFDIDPECEPVAILLNQHHQQTGKFKAFTADMFDLDYNACSYEAIRMGVRTSLTDHVDTIINTSCDHVAPFQRWYERIPSGKLLVLQNNDFADADETHTNTVASLEDFIQQAPMQTLLYSGTLQTQKYSRFMIIGYK